MIFLFKQSNCHASAHNYQLSGEDEDFCINKCELQPDIEIWLYYHAITCPSCGHIGILLLKTVELCCTHWYLWSSKPTKISWVMVQLESLGACFQCLGGLVQSYVAQAAWRPQPGRRQFWGLVTDANTAIACKVLRAGILHLILHKPYTSPMTP